jgi:hypothetical protein
MAKIGTGERDQAMEDNHVTAVNSTPSAKSVKRSTSKTSSLTPAQTLEILQDALRYCQLAGIEMELGTAIVHASDDVNDGTGTEGVALIMRGVVLIDGNLRMMVAK